MCIRDRADGLGVLMVWERDEAHGACDFSRFLQTTPKDLVTPEDVHGQQVPGLYSDIAIAFAPGVHREVSIALIEQALAKRTEPIAKALADVSKHVVSDFKHVGEALRVNEAASSLKRGLDSVKHLSVEGLTKKSRRKAIVLDSDKQSDLRSSLEEFRNSLDASEVPTFSEPPLEPSSEAKEGRRSLDSVLRARNNPASAQQTAPQGWEWRAPDCVVSTGSVDTQRARALTASL